MSVRLSKAGVHFLDDLDGLSPRVREFLTRCVWRESDVGATLETTTR